MASREAIAEVFMVLTSLGYRSPPHASLQARITAWMGVCQPYSDQALHEATVSWARQDREYGSPFPVPGKILGHLEELSKQHEMSGDEAWGHVHDMICNHSTQYAVPGRDFEMHPDPSIAARILKALSAVGGWRGVGMLEQGIVADRAAFRSAWNAAGDRARVHRRMGLTGPSRPLLEVDRG